MAIFWLFLADRNERGKKGRFRRRMLEINGPVLVGAMSETENETQVRRKKERATKKSPETKIEKYNRQGSKRDKKQGIRTKQTGGKKKEARRKKKEEQRMMEADGRKKEEKGR